MISCRKADLLDGFQPFVKRDKIAKDLEDIYPKAKIDIHTDEPSFEMSLNNDLFFVECTDNDEIVLSTNRVEPFFVRDLFDVFKFIQEQS